MQFTHCLALKDQIYLMKKPTTIISTFPWCVSILSPVKSKEHFCNVFVKISMFARPSMVAMQDHGLQGNDVDFSFD